MSAIKSLLQRGRFFNAGLKLARRVDLNMVTAAASIGIKDYHASSTVGNSTRPGIALTNNKRLNGNWAWYHPFFASPFNSVFGVKCVFLTAVEALTQDDLVIIRTESGETLKYPLSWLRDNCQCPKCFDHSSLARKLLLTDFNPDITAKKVSFNQSNDTVKSIFNHFLFILELIALD